MKINYLSNISFKANKMSYSQANYLKKSLLSKDKVDIICHESTDKDSVNSALAVAQYLQAKGVNARIILSQDLKSLHIIDHKIPTIQAKELKNTRVCRNTNIFCVDFSSDDRVSDKIKNYIKSAPKIYGLDHHRGIDIVEGDYISISKPLKNKLPISSVASFYVDSSAKSATAIVYRMFEALGEEITQTQAYELLSGLLSDCNKKNLVICDGEKGKISLTKEFKNDKNTYEIYKTLISKLTKEQIKEIIKSIDLISNLTPEEKAFKKSLKSRLKLSPNKKIAYVEITPDDKDWRNLKGDNPTTSTILNRFRQEVLKNEQGDKNLKDVVVVLTFYKSGLNYRLSAHSKDDSLLDFFDYAKNRTTKSIYQSMGGHPNRGGGKIVTTNKYECARWVKDIISCEDFYD